MGTAQSLPSAGSSAVDRTINSLNLDTLQYELTKSKSMPSPRRESSLSSSSKKSNSSTSTVIPPKTIKPSPYFVSGQSKHGMIDAAGPVCSDKSDSLRRYSVLVNQRGKLIQDIPSETSNSASKSATTERRCSSAKVTGSMDSSRRSEADVSGLRTSSSRSLTPTPPSNVLPKSTSSNLKVSPITSSKSLHNLRSSDSSKSAPTDPSKSRDSTSQSETPSNEEAPSPLLKLWNWVVSFGHEPEMVQPQNERGPLEEALRMFTPDAKWTGRVVFGKYKDESYTLRVVRIRGRQKDGAVKIQCRHKFKVLSGGVDVFISPHPENPAQVLFRYGDHRAKFEGTLDVKTGQLVGSNVVLKNIMSKVPAGCSSTFALARAA